MNLKTSFFNKTLFKANLKRFWWIGVIYFVCLITFGFLPLVNHNSTDGYAIMNVISFLIAAVMPTILFSYLNSPGPVTCLHAFPIKRRAHFITHIVTIFAMLLIPASFAYGIGGIYQATHNMQTTLLVRNSKDLGEMFISLIILVTIFSSGGVLGNMVTGNPIAAIAFSGLFIGFPYYAEGLIASFLQMNVHGIWKYEYITLSNFHIYEVNTYMIVSALIWLFIFYISWLLYKNRKLETNGDIICFEFLKPVFVGCVSVFLGFLGYFYFEALFHYKSIFWMLPFGLIGIIISNMLSKKAFTLKGAVKSGIIYIIGVCILYATINYDLTGYERRIPDIGEIVSVNIVETDQNNDTEAIAYYIDREEYRYTDPYNKSELEFTQKEDIENVRKLHQALINTKDRLWSYHKRIPIVYTLSDGSTLKRIYDIDYWLDAEFLKPIYETKQMRLEKYFFFRDFEKTVKGMTVTDNRILNNRTFLELSENDELTKRLLEAMEQDIYNTDYSTIVTYNDVATKVRISYRRPVHSPDGKALAPDKYPHENSISIGITKSFKNTLAILEEYGLNERIITPEKISSVIVSFDYESEKDGTRITDREQITQLYDLCYNPVISPTTSRRYNDIKAISIYFYGNNNNLLFSEHIDNYNSPLPEFLSEEANKHLLKRGHKTPEATATIVEIE